MSSGKKALATAMGLPLVALSVLPLVTAPAANAATAACTKGAVLEALNSADKVKTLACKGKYAGGLMKNSTGTFGYVVMKLPSAGGPVWSEIDSTKACRSGDLPNKVFKAACQEAECADWSIATALKKSEVTSRKCRQGFAGGSATNGDFDYSYLVMKTKKGAITVWKDVKTKYCAADMEDQVPAAVRKVSCDVS
jgi:hypothetical protein